MDKIQQDKIVKIVILAIIVAALVVGLIMVFLVPPQSSPVVNKPGANKGAVKKPVTAPGGNQGTSPTSSFGEIPAPNMNPITDTGEVVTPQGEPVKLDTIPGAPEAPQQSAPLTPEAIPQNAVKLTVSGEGFKPATFSVNAGEAVILSVTSGDQWTHVFKFKDQSLSAVAIGIGPQESRSIAFNAPAKGEYEFFCDVPGHISRGETGKMIVK